MQDMNQIYEFMRDAENPDVQLVRDEIRALGREADMFRRGSVRNMIAIYKLNGMVKLLSDMLKKTTSAD